jgi:DNA-binding PadR family transcriptional regulator
LSTGTLYGAIKRLLEQGWIERLEGDGENEDKRLRKSYQLTGKGGRILAAEAERLQSLLATAQEVMASAQALASAQA